MGGPKRGFGLLCVWHGCLGAYLLAPGMGARRSGRAWAPCAVVSAHTAASVRFRVLRARDLGSICELGVHLGRFGCPITMYYKLV
eukprot:650330-Prymnesium_polylepis.1